MRNISHHGNLKDYLTKLLHLMLPLIIVLHHWFIKVRAKFNGSCLKESNKLTYSYEANVNIYIVYGLGASGSNDNDPTLINCLFGAVTLANFWSRYEFFCSYWQWEKKHSSSWKRANTRSLILQWWEKNFV